MIAALANIPKSPEDWRFWAWHHRDSHNRIRAAILTQYNINLTDYPIEPIDPNQMSNFLQNNASLHGDMNSTLGLQSADLEDADLSNDNELAAWVRLHWLEHNFVELKLGV